MDNQFDKLRDKLREAGGKNLSCISQVKDEYGNTVERWQITRPDYFGVIFIVVIFPDGGYDLFTHNKGITFDRDIEAILGDSRESVQ
ncbi:hypothetical protein [Alterisphingorhabdus coralli]|uniref:Uncharacterized protein n=1 Tax=Alterisphingorhabdus coralli TaxID=3071408 RepID=A0AA97F8K6_9SPHN|nr:hypothetical protein [Parasphingorhabdus sp. SCSIO 66989]WOE76359.1 hypothetical protein RB602_06500 [Parasphingorhabdus sp. SCSIO 66989]